MFNLIAGIYKPDKGSVVFDSKSLVGRRPARHRRGRHRAYLPDDPPVPRADGDGKRDVGRDCRSRAGVVGAIFHLPSQRAEERDIRVQAEHHMRFMNVWDYRNESPGTCRTATKDAWRSRGHGHRSKTLDPGRAGGRVERARERDLMALIRLIRATGVTIFLIEHDMKVVMGVSDRVMVLDDGRKIAEGTPVEVQAIPK